MYQTLFTSLNTGASLSSVLLGSSVDLLEFNKRKNGRTDWNHIFRSKGGFVVLRIRFRNVTQKVF